jgi:transposase-like protein
LCSGRYCLTLRDLSEIMALRGSEISHEAIRDWKTKLLPVMDDALRERRRGSRRGAGTNWYVEETYLKVLGRWCYLCRTIDRDGNLIDAMLSNYRDMKAAQAFFRSAKATLGLRPDRVTTDGHGSCPEAIRTVLGRTVRHRTSAYLNNRLERDTAASRAGSDVYAASRAPTLLAASVASTASSATFSAHAVVTTRSSPPLSAAPVSPRPQNSRSTSCRLHERTGSARYGCEGWHEL